ncbi:cache domain-containing protein [Bacteriovorax sp. Seq25_V]|uniref:cache domain-containing protein n=1 Tax=Bacteriovorax sp. Seq25_V TaxID=1201288 RepID=UPI000389E505|nr:cache domain-containing protein [Bacteriovorax sp. Seq25_V]EQC44386.1 cache domain protein [Bacteriovorax sp. Seq25_V]
MKKILCILLIMTATPILAQRAKKLELVSFVKEAAAFAKSNGFKKACDEFNDGSKFKRGEFYIFAYNYKGVVLCHGAKKALIGKDLLNFKDVKGTELIKDFIREIKEGNGFVKYYWDHPETKTVKRKLGYAEKINEEYWIGSGIYFEEKE